jgi:hypothetical protein
MRIPQFPSHFFLCNNIIDFRGDTAVKSHILPLIMNLHHKLLIEGLIPVYAHNIWVMHLKLQNCWFVSACLLYFPLLLFFVYQKSTGHQSYKWVFHDHLHLRIVVCSLSLLAYFMWWLYYISCTWIDVSTANSISLRSIDCCAYPTLILISDL